MADGLVSAEQVEDSRKTDGSWPLPTGWCWAELREIGSWTSGGTPKSTERDYYDGPIPWFRITELNEGRLRRAERTLTERGLKESSAKVIAAPFLMFAMYGASIGKMAISDIAAATNQAIACCSVSEGVLIEYLFWALQRSKRSIIALGQGGAQPNISQRILLECKIPLAPVAEQRRVVARVDQMFAEIAEGETALASARDGLDKFRQALLKAAVTGELTKDWRATNPVSETGHAVLARIAKDRVARGRARRNSDFPPLDTSTLDELPVGWAWATLEQIGDPTRSPSYGVLQPGPDCRDGIPMVRVQDINFGTVSLKNVKRISQAIESGYKRTRLQGGELLITLVGTIGRTALAPAELKGANTARAVGVVPLSPIVDARWVEIWLRSPTKQNELVSQAHEVARKTLNLEDVRRATVAIPPPAEAAEIVRRVSDALSASADTLAVLDAEAADTARLKQSVLKAAFEGRLSLQDPADEPADALLARLAANPAPTGARRGRVRKSEV